MWALYAGITERIDNRILDASTTMARPAPADDIAIVAIDEESLRQLGAWPWPRDVHAQLIDRLKAEGARQIIYDVLFIDPTDPEVDARFAAALARAGNVTIPFTFDVVGENGEVGPVYPIPELADAAQSMGHVSAEPDTDGVLRRFALGVDDGQALYPHLTVAAFSARDSGPPFGHGASQPWPIVPFNPTGTFPTERASNIVNGTTASGLLRGKTVYVGATAQGMGDRHPVATGQVTRMPGVETQANLMAALQSDSFISELGPVWLALLTCLVIIMQFVAFWKLPPKSTLLVSAALLALTLLLSVAAVPVARIWIAPGTAVLVLILAYPLWSWRRLSAVSAFLEAEAQQLSASAEPRANSDGFDVVARQVGRMKHLVRNVNDSFVFLRQIIEAAPDPILVLRQDGSVDMWNEKAAALFPEIGPDDDVLFPELFLSQDITLEPDISEVATKDGRTFLMAKGGFENTAAAETAGEVVVLRDISQIRRQEDERREMLEFLSHDMRNPQVAIVGLTQKLAGSIDNDQRLQRIQVQAQRTLKLADDFVQLARLEEAELQFEDTDLVSLVQETCDRAFVAARKYGVTLDQPDPEQPVYAYVEASLIARLLDNLVGNAIKFSPEGSTVSISARESDGGTVELEVSDNGPGLPPERQENPFARFGAHDSKAGPSVGLGLTFVQRAVLKHRGTVHVESGVGQGTRFLVTLPQEQR